MLKMCNWRSPLLCDLVLICAEDTTFQFTELPLSLYKVIKKVYGKYNKRINIKYYTKKSIKPSKKIKTHRKLGCSRPAFGTNKLSHSAGCVGFSWLVLETGDKELETMGQVRMSLVILEFSSDPKGFTWIQNWQRKQETDSRQHGENQSRNKTFTPDCRFIVER